jgi:hypothetical protein
MNRNPDSPAISHEPQSFTVSLANAARFWEPRRIYYNLLLLAVTAFWFIESWPQFRGALQLTPLLLFGVLALFANICYSAAYIPDLLAQRYASALVSTGKRWVLWILGTLFAMLLASYWINDEIYPDFH